MAKLPKTHLVLATAALLALMTPASLFAQKDGAQKDADDDDAPVKAQILPNTGQTLTPLAPKFAKFETLNPGLADNLNYVAGQAGTTVTSPDHKTLLILTSGYNLLNYTSGAQIGQQNNPDSNEYIFVYDISTPQPVKKQVIQVPNTYFGIAFDPSG